jgi:sugar phosphate isomerase/epimerase
MNNLIPAVTIALTARWQTYPDRLNWILKNDFALEYSVNPESPGILVTHVTPFIKSGVPFRYHALFPGYEIGHEDAKLAERATLVHMETMRTFQGIGEQVMTIHVGFNPNDALVPSRIIENLSRIVEYGKKLGITICLENLRRGLPSDPHNIFKWAKAAGAMITLDIGHAVCSELVLTDSLRATDYVEIFADRLYEVHMYEKETNRHHPPQNLNIIGPIVERLLNTQCHWWTIELDDYQEALFTRQLLKEFLSDKPIKLLP